MKINTNHTNIERGGVQSESTFSIKTNALSFQILSSGLYTDPVMAIVRELSCNAYDAHVAANNADVPFEIHLPNELEPFLSIKDYGVGLSDEDIQGAVVPVMRENDNGEIVETTDNNGNTVTARTGGLYTTYFDSTKTNSNDFIGALGLGSKSPFSYSEAFEVISRHEGKKRTYAIFLNEEGIPSVALMGMINTDEHSGLEVKITIKKEDFYKFKAKTATALTYFPIKPKIIGALNFTFDKIPEYAIKTKEWMISANSYHNMTAVQGNVAYRVDPAQLNEVLDSSLMAFLSRSNIVVFFDIGELEVSANREEIRYDKRTVGAIAKRIGKISTEFTREVEKKIGKINKKYWYACIELNELSLNIFSNSTTIRSFVDPDKVKSKNLKQYIENSGTIKYSSVLGYDITRYNVSNYYGKSTKLKRSVLHSTFTPAGGTLVVINDIKRGGLKRLSNYLDEHSYNEAIVITKRVEPYTEIDELLQPVKYVGYKKEFKRLVKELGSPDIHNISEITDELEKVKVNRELSFYQYDGMVSSRSYYSPDKISWARTTGKIDDGGLYIPLKYASQACLVNSDGKLEPLSFEGEFLVEILNFLISEYNNTNDTNHSIHSIRALPTAAFNKAKKLDEWVNLFDFGKELLPKYMDEMVFYKNKNITPNILEIKDAIKFDDFVSNIKKLDKDSIFKLAIMPLIKGKEKYGPNNSLQRIKMIEELHGKICNKKIVGTAFYENNAFDEYPMLTIVADLNQDTNWSTLFDYIKLIDRSK